LQAPAAFLAALDGALRDGNQAVARVREFDRAQQALAAWDEEQAIALRQAGDAALADERTRSARDRIAAVEEAYLRVLRRHPKNARALNYYGELLYDRLRRESEGVQFWEKAAAADSRYAAPRNNLGIHYCHAGDYAKGFTNFDRALKLEPDNPDFLYNHAQVLLIHRSHAQRHYRCTLEQVYVRAMEESKKAVAIQPDDFELARDYAQNFFAAEQFGVEADWRLALEAWARARALAGSSAEEFLAWMYEARAAIRLGDNDHARHALRQALALKPDSAAAKALMDRIGDPAASLGSGETP